MKKYMIPIAASLLLTAGMVNAQSTAKTTKPASAKAVTTKKSTEATNAVASAAPASGTGEKATATTPVSRKHHQKKNKPQKKTESK